MRHQSVQPGRPGQTACLAQTLLANQLVAHVGCLVGLVGLVCLVGLVSKRLVCIYSRLVIICRATQCAPVIPNNGFDLWRKQHVRLIILSNQSILLSNQTPGGQLGVDTKMPGKD